MHSDSCYAVQKGSSMSPTFLQPVPIRIHLSGPSRHRLPFLIPFPVSDISLCGSGRRDAGRKWKQRCRPPGQAEEEISQLVHPQDQQHRAGALWPAERDAGRTGDDPCICTLMLKQCLNKTKAKACWFDPVKTFHRLAWKIQTGLSAFLSPLAHFPAACQYL